MDTLFEIRVFGLQYCGIWFANGSWEYGSWSGISRRIQLYLIFSSTINLHCICFNTSTHISLNLGFEVRFANDSIFSDTCASCNLFLNSPPPTSIRFLTQINPRSATSSSSSPTIPPSLSTPLSTPPIPTQTSFKSVNIANAPPAARRVATSSTSANAINRCNRPLAAVLFSAENFSAPFWQTTRLHTSSVAARWSSGVSLRRSVSVTDQA